VLKENFHPRAKRFLLGGLVLGLGVMALLIALVVSGTAPAIIFGILAVFGMTVLCLGDLQRREQLRRRDAEKERAEAEPQHARPQVRS
jgi:hypothetical protein